jgi:hypothetical protein
VQQQCHLLCKSLLVGLNYVTDLVQQENKSREDDVNLHVPLLKYLLTFVYLSFPDACIRDIP